MSEDDDEPVPTKWFVDHAADVSRLSNKDWMRLQLTLRDHVEDNYPPSVGRVFREIVRLTNRSGARPARSPQHLYRGTAWPRIKVVAKRLKLEKSTIKKAIRKLKKAGIIFVHYRNRKGWGNLASQYVVNIRYLENYPPSAGGEKSPRVEDERPLATGKDVPPNIYQSDSFHIHIGDKSSQGKEHGVRAGATECAPSALTFDEAVRLSCNVDETTSRELVCQIMRVGGNGCVRESLLSQDSIEPIYDLMREGCDFHSDIWMALREKCVMGRGDGSLPKINSWQYLHGMSHEFRSMRLEHERSTPAS